MSLKDYVVDVETAKKLGEKGFKGEAFYHYARLPNYYPIEVPTPKYEFNPKDWDFMEGKKEDLKLEYSIDADYIPTYILAQVLDELPKQFRSNEDYTCGELAMLDLFAFGEHIGYTVTQAFVTVISFDFKVDNPATAAAKLWLWAKEMGHLGGEK